MSQSRRPAAGPQVRPLSFALVVSPLLIGNAVMLALCLLGFYVLSATRAYVGGESQWSKSRVMAVAHLKAYAATGKAADFERLTAALDTQLGDMEARLELDKPRPDLVRAQAAFVRGGNAPEDVQGMVLLYRWFGQTSLMRDALDAWRRGDELMLKLQATGLRVQHQFGEGATANSAPVLATLAGLNELEGELLGLERQFSHALGEASRATFHLLAAVATLTALALTLTAYLMARAALRRQAQSESALEDANNRWRLAAESDGLGVFEWHQASEAVLLDARACAIYGLTSGPEGLTVPRTQLRTLVEPVDAVPLQAQLDEAIHSSELFRHRYRIHVAGDGWRQIEVTGVMRGALKDGDRRMVGIIKDVNLQVQQEQLTLEKAAAERTAAARMEFLSRLSHELRTPLNAVLGFSELMLMDTQETAAPKQRERVRLIMEAGKHLLHLVNDVLDISGIDSGNFKMERVATPLAPVVAASVSLVSSECQGTPVQITARSDPAHLLVWADGQRLGQVLANLLSNACKYNRQGGSVTVDARAVGERVEIAIADQGQGLSGDEMAQLFQPFKRLQRTAHVSGTGLGLSIVKLLVEQMGARSAWKARWARARCSRSPCNAARTGEAARGPDAQAFDQRLRRGQGASA